MSDLREGDLVDITLRRVIVRAVHERGTLSIQHSDVELEHFDPTAIDVEVTFVGQLPPCPDCDGFDPYCRVCDGSGTVFR